MTRLEYLDILEQKLKKYMSQKEVNDIVRDYAEYFEEGKAQGKTDEETAAKLGAPEKIAEQILEENNYDVELNSIPDRKKHIFTNSKEKVKNGFSTVGNRTKQFFGGFFNFVKRLNIPSFLKNAILIIIGIPLALILLGIGFFAAAAIICFILAVLAGLLIVGCFLFIPAVLLIAGSGLIFDFVYVSIPILAIICGVGCLALGLCLIGFALVICQSIKQFFTEKYKKLKIDSESEKEISPNEEGSENND